MLIGSNFGFFIKYDGLEDTLRKLANAGFQAVDFSLTRDFVAPEKEKEYFKDIKKLCDDLGLTISQGHSYFARTDCSPEYFLSEEYKDLQLKSLRRAEYLKIPWVVIHPFTNSVEEGVENVYDKAEAEKETEINLKFYRKLAPYYADAGIGIAVENLAEYDYKTLAHCHCFGSTSKELNFIIDELNRERKGLFGACFDAGHANLLVGEKIDDFILSLGKRLKVLHLHDNFGILNCWGGGLDRHLPPFFGGMPWGDLVKALYKIGFDGSFSFEIGNFYPDSDFAFIMAQYVKKAAEYMLKNYS